ncbi:MAG: phage portal protein, partial [Pseudomonadota bacterium]
MFDFLRRETPAAPEAKASAAGRVIAHHSAGRVAWSPRDAVSLTKAGFAANPVGFRCVKLIAEAAAALPLVLQDRTNRYDTHPVLDLVERPNAGQGRAELLEALYGHLLLSGNAYVEVALADDGAPLELHVLRSDRMSVVPGADGWPVAFEYAVAGRKHRFDASGVPGPICHIKSFHPQDDHYGLSPMQAAATALDVHNSATRWSKGLLDNSARPSGAIVHQSTDGLGTLGQDQYDRLVSELEAYHQGARNAGRPMLLDGGLDWKPMGFSPSDMEFQKTKEAAMREVALAFGVPPMLLGLAGDATYNNYQEAHRAFYR